MNAVCRSSALKKNMTNKMPMQSASLHWQPYAKTKKWLNVTLTPKDSDPLVYCNCCELWIWIEDIRFHGIMRFSVPHVFINRLTDLLLSVRTVLKNGYRRLYCLKEWSSLCPADMRHMALHILITFSHSSVSILSLGMETNIFGEKKVRNSGYFPWTVWNRMCFKS